MVYLTEEEFENLSQINVTATTTLVNSDQLTALIALVSGEVNTELNISSDITNANHKKAIQTICVSQIMRLIQRNRQLNKNGFPDMPFEVEFTNKELAKLDKFRQTEKANYASARVYSLKDGGRVL